MGIESSETCWHPLLSLLFDRETAISKQWIHINDTPCGVSCTGQATVEIRVECSCSYLATHQRNLHHSPLSNSSVFICRWRNGPVRFLLFLKCAWLFLFTCLLTRLLSSLRDCDTWDMCWAAARDSCQPCAVLSDMHYKNTDTFEDKGPHGVNLFTSILSMLLRSKGRSCREWQRAGSYSALSEDACFFMLAAIQALYCPQPHADIVVWWWCSFESQI